MKLICGFLLSLLLLTESAAQVSFSLSDTYVSVVKPASSFVAYDYAEITNNTGSDLNMRWVALPPDAHSPVIPPATWEYTFQDPENFYEPPPDSADFTLGATPQSTDKLILQAYPGNTPGHGIFRYKIYPVDNPEDAVVLTFDYTFEEVVSTDDPGAAEQSVRLYPNPSPSSASLQNNSVENWDIQIWSSAGRLIKTFRLLRGESAWLTAPGQGLYFIRGASARSAWTQRWLANE